MRTHARLHFRALASSPVSLCVCVHMLYTTVHPRVIHAFIAEYRLCASRVFTGILVCRQHALPLSKCDSDEAKGAQNKACAGF